LRNCWVVGNTPYEREGKSEDGKKRNTLAETSTTETIHPRERNEGDYITGAGNAFPTDVSGRKKEVFAELEGGKEEKGVGHRDPP